MKSKAERLAEIIKRLDEAEPASDASEALGLLTSTMNAVEDEFTDMPYDPDKWDSDGRMYPPQTDNERPVEGHPDVRRYRNRGHNTFIGDDGSIQIFEIGGKCLLNKPGQIPKRTLG